tara:strand:- start:4945 stop:5727 length:783 start_codon:yes stop_codon:yes gene_type:complete
MDTITCLWIQETLDNISTDAIKSWIALGYHVNLYTYSKLFNNNISYTNLHIKNANDIILKEDYDTDQKEVMADRFRFQLFRNNANTLQSEIITWMDTDIILLRKLPNKVNYVSSQLTPQSGIYCCKEKVIANIGVMCFDGNEKIDWYKILTSKSKKKTIFQSKYLKSYEKEMKKWFKYVLPAKSFCAVHWSYTKELFTENDFTKPYKFNIEQKKINDIINDPDVIGIHVWRQIYKKKMLNITEKSIYNTLLKFTTNNKIV